MEDESWECATRTNGFLTTRMGGIAQEDRLVRIRSSASGEDRARQSSGTGWSRLDPFQPASCPGPHAEEGCASPGRLPGECGAIWGVGIARSPKGGLRWPSMSM